MIKSLGMKNKSAAKNKNINTRILTLNQIYFQTVKLYLFIIKSKVVFLVSRLIKGKIYYRICQQKVLSASYP